MDPALQHRGTPDAYDRYLKAMDGSMRQKVALTAAHLPALGRVADMGMGSGSGTHAIAALYPDLSVVGIDLDPTMVSRARKTHVLDNLTFALGDIGAAVFPDESLDGLLDSSVLHHVTSFAGYDAGAAAKALQAQTRQLRRGGVLIVRDFVAPDPGRVWLDLRSTDGDDGDDPRTCSTARLLERFSRDFRLMAASPGFDLVRLGGADAQPGFLRYELDRRHAVEFLLRKDYRADWEAEAKEEYTYFTQAEFEAQFAALGLRLLASTPLRNPWLLRHRWEGQYSMRLVGDERVLEHPPTNYLIVGERVADGAGVRIEAAPAEGPPTFLELTHYRHRDTGCVVDLVHRPHPTLDVIPWFLADTRLFVLARCSYPRPILAELDRAGGALDGSTSPSYVTEPLSVLMRDSPLGSTIEEALASDAGIPAEDIVSLVPAGHYYPSPGGTREDVRATHVEVRPRFSDCALGERSGFSASGRVRTLDAQQLLRSAHVGGLPDARLELNVYELLRRLRREPGPWLGEALELPERAGSQGPRELAAWLARPGRRAFVPCPSPGAGFLELLRKRFQERDAEGRLLAERVLEYVRPQTLSLRTVAVAVLRRAAGEVFIGLDDTDMPAAQCFCGDSRLLVAPAWRLPPGIYDGLAARAWVLARLREEYGVSVGASTTLGGNYRPSAGVSPEAVHPLAVDAACEVPARLSLTWVSLGALIDAIEHVQDGHLRILAWRAAHALGLLARA